MQFGRSVRTGGHSVLCAQAEVRHSSTSSTGTVIWPKTRIRFPLVGSCGQSYATLLDLGSLDSHCHPRSRWHHHHRCCCRFHQETATDRRCDPCGPEIPSLSCTATLAPYRGMDISWPRSRSL